MDVTKDKRLPKASLLLVEWHWWWFKRGYSWHPIFMKSRGANFFQFWLGPLTVIWRRPWLEGPARQHLERHYKPDASATGGAA